MRLPVSTDVCWHDGLRIAVADATVAISDPTLQSGLGLFETLALRDGAVLDLDAHVGRLERGAQRLGLPLPAAASVRATVLAAAAGQAPVCGWIKILLSGAGTVWVLRGAMDASEEGAPASAVLLPWRRNAHDPLAGLKTLNYAANQLGLERARVRGADEGLWLNGRGHLAEGCASNLFVVHGKALFTPALRDGILPGVLRERVLGAARSLGMPVHEGKLRLPRLRRAREAFLTSSLRAVRPLVSFEGRPLGDGRPGPWTRRIAREVAGMRQYSRAADPA